MDPRNGEILAMVNYPEFDLNDPYALPEETENLTGEQKQEKLNAMWRNGCINDTYEPGSTFKIITAAAGLEERVVTTESTFSCPGFIIVDDRKIRCHKTMIFIICIDTNHPATLKKPFFTAGILPETPMLPRSDMVHGQISINSNGKGDSFHPVMLQSLGGYFHHTTTASGIRHFPQFLL